MKLELEDIAAWESIARQHMAMADNSGSELAVADDTGALAVFAGSA